MSSLLNYLSQTGSALSYYRDTFEEDQIIDTNPQANRGNKYSIHSNNGDDDNSYSLNGSGYNDALDAYNSYNDGFNNYPPPPSNFLDLNGYPPSLSNFYVNNTPEGVNIVRG